MTVRFTEEEYAALKGKCEIAGMKMEPFVRALVDGCRIKPAPPDSYNKLRQQLSAIGNNLNQLTHVANATGRVSAPQLDRAQSLLEDMWRCVRDSLLAYNLATILAEKLETVISRSDQNTRPRDYYDVYILTKLQAENIDFPALGAALMATASKRGSDSILQDYRAIVEAVRNSEIMRRQWDNYRKDFDYASTISFDEVCDAVASTMDTLITNNFFN